MKTPDFFFHGQGIWPRLLSPFSTLWLMGAAWKRSRTQTVKVKVPVICVGNLTVGGTGKTPVVIALAHFFRQAGQDVHIVTRGYGGSETGPLRVETNNHSAGEVGDEALLLAAAAPTWVGKDRAAAAEAAVAAGAELILMDDGHQNFSLAKDYSLVVIDRAYGFGSGRIMPAGPLRESVEQGLERADAIVLIASGDHIETTNWRQPVKDTGLPVIRGSLETGIEAEQFTGQNVVAFAGIGRPEKFFTTLRNLKCNIVSDHAFPDHHVFSADEVMKIVEEAARQEARPVTTSKDFVRLPPEARPMVSEIPVGIVFENPRTLNSVFENLVGQNNRHNA